MRLDIRFSNRPLEDLWCQAVTALVFQNPSITRGVFSNLNRKMTGALENILRRDAWKGERGEKLLIATQNTIRADKLLFHGLGPSSDFKVAILEEEVRGLGMALDKMGVNDFGIYMPVAEGHEGKYGYHLELSTSNLVKTFYKRHGKDPDFILKIIFSVEKDFLDILNSVVGRLKKHLQPIRDFTIIIDPMCKGREAKNINPSKGTDRNKEVA